MDGRIQTSAEIRTAIAALSENLFRYVIQLFTIGFKGRLVPHGTGLLVHDGRDTYIVSAAHVFDVLKDGVDLIFHSQEKVIRKIDGLLLNEKAPGGERKADRIDIGVLKLRSNRPPYAGADKLALPMQLLRPYALPRTNKRYLITGFPCSKSRFHPLKRVIDSAPYAHCGRSLGTPYPVGFSEETHIAISFDHKNEKVIRQDGTSSKVPSPRGMSGSPVWALESTGYIERETASVVGIFIEHRTEYKALIATDIAYAFDRIMRHKS